MGLEEVFSEQSLRDPTMWMNILSISKSRTLQKAANAGLWLNEVHFLVFLEQEMEWKVRSYTSRIYTHAVFHAHNKEKVKI